MMYGGAIVIASCFLFSIFVSVCHGCPNGYNGSPCTDYEPPRLTCPGPNLQTNTMEGKATARVLWTIQVTDNSVDVDPNAVIAVRSSHEPGQELPIGQTTISFNATDEAGNVAACSFVVDVRDTEPPTCSFCPADIVREEINPVVRVNWDHPSCSDNSGIPPTIQASRQSGDLFAGPGSYIIAYTVMDNSLNVNRNCSFKITLKVKTCPKFPPPRNGALACTTDDDALICAVLCKNGTDFESDPPLFYYCSAATWQTWMIGMPGQLPWPDCSDKANPSFLKMMGLSNYFYIDDEHDPNRVQEAIKVKFHSQLIDPRTTLPSFCLSRPTCTKDNILVSLGVRG